MITPLSLNTLLEDLTVLMEPFYYYQVYEENDRLYVYACDIMSRAALSVLVQFAFQHHIEYAGVEPHDKGVRFYMYL